MTPNYATDFNLWAQQTARLLREQRWQEVDLPHLIEEVEDLSKNEQCGIASQLTRLLLHLLKWRYQLQRRSDSRLDSINDARLQIELALEDSPSLKNYPHAQLAACYRKARAAAAGQTGLAAAVFPEACPFALEGVLADGWMPEE